MNTNVTQPVQKDKKRSNLMVLKRGVDGKFPITPTQMSELNVTLPRCLNGAGLRLLTDGDPIRTYSMVGFTPPLSTAGLFQVGEINRLFAIPKLIGGAEAAAKKDMNIDDALLVLYLKLTADGVDFETYVPNLRSDFVPEMTKILDVVEKMQENMHVFQLHSRPTVDGHAYQVLIAHANRIRGVAMARINNLADAQREHPSWSDMLFDAHVPMFIFNKLTDAILKPDQSQTILGIFWSRNANNGPTLSYKEIEDPEIWGDLGVFISGSEMMVVLANNARDYFDPEDAPTSLDEENARARLDKFKFNLLSPEHPKRIASMKYDPPRGPPPDGDFKDMQLLYNMHTFVMCSHYLKFPPGRPYRPFYLALGFSVNQNLNMTIEMRIRELVEAHDNFAINEGNGDDFDRKVAAINVLRGGDPIEFNRIDDFEATIAVISDVVFDPAYGMVNNEIKNSEAFKTFSKRGLLGKLYPDRALDKTINPCVALDKEAIKLLASFKADDVMAPLGNDILNHIAGYSCPELRDAAVLQIKACMGYVRNKRMLSITEQTDLGEIANLGGGHDATTENEHEDLSEAMAQLFA
jgi:hypothetical protein